MITFHKAKMSDLKGILDVLIDTNYVKFFKKPYDVDLLKYLKKRHFFIAKDGDLIIAYASFNEPQKRFYKAPIKVETNSVSSSGVGVLTQYRKKGIATKLKLFCEKELKQMGVNFIYTDVSSFNQPSLKLQEKLGFKQIVCYESDFRKKEGELNCIFMKKL